MVMDVKENEVTLAVVEPKASVIVPARNEVSSIGRTLAALFDGLAPGDLDVIVACDGCTDGTADLVRGLDLAVRVIELPPTGKAGALRAAEALTSTLPRIYLDADVRVSGPTVVRVAEALSSGSIAARPPVRFDTQGASWPVRRYYAARSRIPSVVTDLCGAGIYGLSADARGRFDEFPDVTADDLFAARIVDPEEVEIIASEPVIVTTPRTAGALTNILARTYRGNREIHESWPLLDQRPASMAGGGLLAQLRHPSAWLDVSIYLAFSIVGRLASRFSRARWERDETSRTPSDGPTKAH